MSYVTDLKKYGVLNAQGDRVPVHQFQYMCIDCDKTMISKTVLTKCRYCGSSNLMDCTE